MEREVHQRPRHKSKRKQWSPPPWLRHLAKQAPAKMLRLGRTASRGGSGSHCEYQGVDAIIPSESMPFL
eukprot:1841116-Amphidinium_carterae.2